ncbi:MAG: protein kinase, partial [Blautia sp.]|nr:protein kinase [Blautia sp.]
TESYMAPEVFYGKVYDATVDLYSLGIVLYQLANKGKLPFVPPDREVVSYSDVTKAKQRRLKGEILPDPAMGGHVLGDILRKACAVNPRDRYQSPQEMYEELEKLLQSYDQNQKDQETAKVSEKERAEEDIHFFSGLEDDLEKTEAEKTESVKPERVIVQPVEPENKTPKTPKKSSKMPAIIGILCIAGIAMAAFGYMRMGNSQKIESKENQEVSATAIPTISAAPTEAPIETPTEAPVPTVEISPTEAALEENTEETDWFNDFDNRDSEETDWFDDWNYDENGNKVN